MARLDHKDEQAIIVNLIDHAIVANTDPPLKASLQLACTRWPRLFDKRFDYLNDAFRGLSVEPLERFPCSTREDDAICQGAVSPRRAIPTVVSDGRFASPECPHGPQALR